MWWSIVSKIIGTILGMKNQRAGQIFNTAMGLSNSARNVPKPEARQM